MAEEFSSPSNLNEDGKQVPSEKSLPEPRNDVAPDDNNRQPPAPQTPEKEIAGTQPQEEPRTSMPAPDVTQEALKPIETPCAAEPSGERLDSPVQTPPHWGVLVREEIKNQGLIRNTDAEREDQRCYQPASYDLRLGSEYIIPHGSDIVDVLHSDKRPLTIPRFGTAIVSTYEIVSLPRNVVGRFDLRIDHALEGLIVQMGTQVEPGYEGPLFALLHNISNQPKTLKFCDYDTRPFTIEFSYTSQVADAKTTGAHAKRSKSLIDFIPPNYAREGIDIVFANMQSMQTSVRDLSKEVNSKQLMWFTGILFVLVLATATIFIPITLSKFTYDKDYFPIVNADAIAAMKYGSSHSSSAEGSKGEPQQTEPGFSTELLPRDVFYAVRLSQLKARREAIKNSHAQTAELKAIDKQIEEIIELLRQ